MLGVQLACLPSYLPNNPLSPSPDWNCKTRHIAKQGNCKTRNCKAPAQGNGRHGLPPSPHARLEVPVISPPSTPSFVVRFPPLWTPASHLPPSPSTTCIELINEDVPPVPGQAAASLGRPFCPLLHYERIYKQRSSAQRQQARAPAGLLVGNATALPMPRAQGQPLAGARPSLNYLLFAR
jgi:hypothetical protein